MMEPLFYVRQLIKKYREKEKKLCMVFTNVNKTYDGVTKEVFKWV